MKREDLLGTLRVEPGVRPRLDQRDPGARLGAADKQDGLRKLTATVERLSVLHDRLWAEGSRAVLLVLQGMDTSGKDGTIRHVCTGINPQGCRVVSFKQPTVTELAHDYLWRVHASLPARGELGIFNRSHYEDVVIVRVKSLVDEHVWPRRYQHIREFERLLVDEGTTVVKVFLHISRDEQRKRLQERIDNPEKRWKFRPGDLDERALWNDYMTAYEDALFETSTSWAPWYVVPADRNWVRNLAVGEVLLDVFDRLDPQLPAADPAIEGLEVT